MRWERQTVKERSWQSKKARALVAVESSPSTEVPRKGRPAKVVGHLKMKVIPDLEAKTIINVVKEQPDTSVELTTDDSTSYVRFKELVESHRTVTSGKEAVRNFLSWVHIAIGNAKRLLPDVHYYINIEYLQYYLG